jgi:pyruvate,water dikinase
MYKRGERAKWREGWRPKKRYHEYVLSYEDLQAYPCWYLDAGHSIPPWTPLFAWSWTHHQRYGDLWAAETMGFPTSRGTDWREVDGCGYMSPVLVTDKSEQKERAIHFKEHLKPFIEDYDSVWSGVVTELMDKYQKFKAFDVMYASNSALYDHFDSVFRFNNRVWALHSWIMYTLSGLYALFEDLCRERIGINDTSPVWHRMIRGFDNKNFEVDRLLWSLYKHAVELGIDGIIKRNPLTEIIPSLMESNKGERWLNEKDGFQEFLNEHGWRLPRMMEFNCKAWIEDPSPAFSFIRQYIDRSGQFEMDIRRKGIVHERKEAEQEILSHFPDSQKGWIKKLMKVAQQAGIFSEGHNYYFEHMSHSLMRRAGLACGKRMANKGLLEDPEDFVFLLPDEIKKNIITLCLDYHALVSERKEYYNECSQRLNRPALIGELSDDPHKAIEYMGLSKDDVMMKITVGAEAVASVDFKADLYGNPGAPGIGEGTVRVILSEKDIPNIRSGNILVSTTTYSSWTPVFSLLKGVVLDSGASLSHAAIVGREYDIPVVIQTKNATKTLKNGQKVKVDGTRGAVWIMQE